MNVGEPDYAFDVDEVSLIVGRMWHDARPASLLLQTWDKVICQGEKESRNGGSGMGRYGRRIGRRDAG